MTDQYHCPLCMDAYEDRTDLRIHLEVNHRKSEIVSAFLDHDAPERTVPSPPLEEASTPV